MSGTKFDQEKIRLELIPPELIDAVGKILTFGAKKYEPRNWEKGIEWSRVFGALQRHAWAWYRGEDKDPETGESHLAHAACCIAFLIAYEDRQMAEFDDRPKTIKAPDMYFKSIGETLSRFEQTLTKGGVDHE